LFTTLKKSNRESLRLRYTLLFGGHVENENNSTQPVIDCLNRELQEELEISFNGTATLLGIVADPTTNVGLLHLGLIFEVITLKNEITIGPNLDSIEFVNSNKIETYNMIDWNALVNIADKLDPWSRLFLDSDIAHQILKAPIRQMQLPLTWQS
jgi:predicted NUDIX family phosphoesterase